jgi:PAS domain S-box-containing protein
VYRPLFTLFAAFILFCGLGHLLNVVTLWVPAYGIEGLIKAATAVISFVTAISLRGLMPQILLLPSHVQLRKVQSDLAEVRQAEIRMSEIAEEANATRAAMSLELARREAAEKQMQESEERFQLLLQSNVTEALYLMDRDGTIETWNVAAERIKGYAAEEVIGRNFAMFFTPEELALGMPAQLLARARDTGRFTDEGWRVRKDGGRFLARVSVDAIRRPNGSLRGFVKVTQDITDRRIEEEQRAIIVEAAPNGMMIVDEHGIITLANRQISRIFDYPEGALVGQMADILIPREHSEAHDLLHAALTQGVGMKATGPQQSFDARRRDGSTVPIELMVSTVKTPRGHIVVASVFDISERLREAAAREDAERRERLTVEMKNVELDRLSHDLATARDRAEQANSAKSRFLAAITHELRTPLHGLLGYAELLTLEGGLNNTQRKRLETMMAAGQHLLGMVNSVLDMSQIEADRLEVAPVDVELCDLIGVCLNVVRPAAESRSLVLGDAPVDLCRVVADPTRLRQVLINMLGNAVKFTPAGRIDVRVRRTENDALVRVEVADTGPGVRPGNRDKLFQTFERLNAAAVSGIEGAGLGLAISARLMDLMGGRIGYNDNPGGGSVFWVELPVCQGAGCETGETLDTPLQAEGPRLRVMVADDEALNRSIAGSFLQNAGHETVCVTCGRDAVEIAASEDFDVVLMDVRMPGMNGMEAAGLIRNIPGRRGQVRIVAVTAHAFAEQIELCQQAGMDGHLSKPFTQAMLLASLRGDGPPSRASAATALAGPACDPIFDRQVFQETVEFLPPEQALNHLRTLLANCEAMLSLLHMPNALDARAVLIDGAHGLAGTASMFGLLAVGAAARAFERAVETGAPATASLAQRLEVALSASIKILRAELDVSTTR